jgi:hypothetical protein
LLMKMHGRIDGFRHGAIARRFIGGRGIHQQEIFGIK